MTASDIGLISLLVISLTGLTVQLILIHFEKKKRARK